LGVEFALLTKKNTKLLMEQLSASENIVEQIDIEPFQNEKLMDDISIIETSIENLSFGN
jgi:hypothetical protein